MFHTPAHKVPSHLPQAGQIVNDPRVGFVEEQAALRAENELSLAAAAQLADEIDIAEREEALAWESEQRALRRVEEVA